MGGGTRRVAQVIAGHFSRFHNFKLCVGDVVGKYEDDARRIASRCTFFNRRRSRWERKWLVDELIIWSNRKNMICTCFDSWLIPLSENIFRLGAPFLFESLGVLLILPDKLRSVAFIKKSFSIFCWSTDTLVDFSWDVPHFPSMW